MITHNNFGVANRSPIQAGILLLAFAASLLLGTVAALSPLVALLLCGTCVAVGFWAWISRTAGVLLAAALPISLAGLLVPFVISTAAQLSLAIFAVLLVIAGIARRDPVAPVAFAALMVVALWIAFTLNPNVPSFSVGLLGARKISFAFVGLAIGLLWPKGSSSDAEKLLVRLMLIAGALAVILHLSLPALEHSFSRGASEYTEEFQGHVRMAAFFAGPFHVSLLGAFLMLYGWHSYLSRKDSLVLSAAFVLIGALLVIFAGVRTGYLAVIAGLLITPLLSPSQGQSRWKVVVLTTLAVSCAAALILSSLASNNVLSSIPHLGSDSRVQSRFETVYQAENMIQNSPVIGWGAGSAGATLGEDFGLHQHVTSHNLVIGLLVEGGVVGLLVVLVPFILLSKYGYDFRSISHPAAAAAITLGAFALTGDVTEALPISLFLLILIGLRGRTDSGGVLA